MKNHTGGTSPLDDPRFSQVFRVEHEETIQRHIRNIILQEGLAGRPTPRNPGPEFYAQFADRGNEVEGSAACAYMAGILYKNRMLGGIHLDGGRNSIRSRVKRSDKGVLETDELAYKYLLQASEGGIPTAMQSLAKLYEKGQGVRKRLISACDWLWQALLMGTADGVGQIDSKALLPLELGAIVQQFQQGEMYLLPGQSFSTSGPHLSSLLSCFARKLMM
jgi:hypothetical protein